jgi:hypothetical protein
LYIRQWRSRLAVIWLLSQAASIALAAGSLPHVTGFAAAAGTCTCPGDHADEACPMHKPVSDSSDATDDCLMRSAHAPTDAALLSLATGLGIPASATVAIGPASTHPIVVVAIASAGAANFPDSPPPRA